MMSGAFYRVLQGVVVDNFSIERRKVSSVR